MAGDLSQRTVADLMAELVTRQGRLQAELGEIAQLQAELGRRALGQVPAAAEYPVDLEGLAKLFAVGRSAMAARLKRPAWRWLRVLGDRRRDGRGRLWLWSEVEAERTQRKESR
jgi:hypothetical protein